MSFMDPKPVTVAGLDAATAAKVNTPGSATATALSATILDQIETDVPTLPKFGAVLNMDEFSGADDSAQLQAAINAVVASGSEATIQISKPLTLTSTVTVDTGYVSLEFFDGPINASAITTGAAFRFLNSRDVTGATANGIANNRKTYRGLKLHGPAKTNVGSIGLLFDSTVGSNRGLAFYDTEIRGFEDGHQIRGNSYLISFYNFHFYQSARGVHMPTGYSNYGENIKYIGGGIGSCDIGVVNANSDGNLHFVSTSFDFCGQVAVATSGGIFLVCPHIEGNKTGSVATGSQFVTGTNQRAKIVISGGGLMTFHDPLTNINYLYETQNTNWGGGIFVGPVEHYNTTTGTGYLCGGTGNIYYDRPVKTDGGGSGSGGGSVLTSKTMNRLIDGGFDLATVVDAYLIRAEATSRVASPATDLSTNASALLVTKKTTGLSEFVLHVPVQSGREYAAAFIISEILSTGNLSVNEQFVALGDKDVRGIPAELKKVERTSTTFDLGATTAPYERAFGSTSWNRVAPAWATHFRLRFILNSVAVGSFRLSEVVITER